MKITINATHNIKGLDLVKDKRGNFWRLPFIDKRGRNMPPKRLNPILHQSKVKYRVYNKYFTEFYLNQNCIRNPRSLVYQTNENQAPRLFEKTATDQQEITIKSYKK